MKQLFAGVVSAVGLGLVGAPAVEAHELTCSKSRFGHREDLKRYKALKVDDVPRAFCFDTGRDRVRFVACRGRFCVRQDVRKTSESGVGPFYTAVTYSIGPVRWGYHG